MKPLLTVLIDTYNHERYIEHAVVSAIEQDFPSSDCEILVVDDGSEDRTAEIVRKFAPRVRLLRKKNGGQASAFNAAFPEVRGEIVAFLDGDDWFAPGKLYEVMNAFERHPEASGVGHGYYEFHEATKEAHVRMPQRSQFFNLASPDAAHEARLGWPFLIIGALTVRRNVLNQVMPVPESLVFCADGPIAVASIAMGVRVLEKPLCYYRHHSDNLHAVDPNNRARMRRRFEINELMFDEIEALLTRLGVSRQSIAAFLYPSWVEHSRAGLPRFGGRRIKTFETELRAFRVDNANPSLSYRAFKYAFVGAATLVLSPGLFYRARAWYGRQNLGRFRERFAKAARRAP